MGGACADAELQNGLIRRPAVLAEGEHAERAAGLLIPEVLHMAVIADAGHRLLHDAVRAKLRRRDRSAGRQDAEKVLAFKGRGLRVIVQKLLRRMAAVDLQQIAAVPDKAHIRHRTAQHILHRGLQRIAEPGGGAEERVEHERADNGIERPVHAAGLHHAGQDIVGREFLQRRKNAAFRVSRVLRAAQIAAVEQIGDVSGHQLGRHARDGVRATLSAVGIVDDLDGDRRAGAVIELDQPAQPVLFGIKIHRAERQPRHGKRFFRSLRSLRGILRGLQQFCRLRSGLPLRTRRKQQKTGAERKKKRSFHRVPSVRFIRIVRSCKGSRGTGCASRRPPPALRRAEEARIPPV